MTTIETTSPVLAWLVQRPDGSFEIHTMTNQILTCPGGKGWTRDRALDVMAMIVDRCRKMATEQN